ncbi:MAG: Mg/Co/Ni transporter MgtE [Alphaproteobacteria bacterium]|jgi:Mg/Co/Ni transporter MgtE
MANHNLKLTIHFFSEEPFAAAQKLDLMAADDATAVLQKVPISVAVKVICAMQPSSASKIIVSTPIEFTRALFQSIELADIAAILRYVNIQDRKNLFDLLPKSRQALCNLLISYPENTVGALIETNVLVVDSQMTSAEAMLRVKKQVRFDTHEVLVVSSKRKIIGKISIFDLIRSPALSLVSALPITSVVTVNGLSYVTTVMELDEWKKTDTITVVNRKQAFIGIVRHFDLRASFAKNKQSTQQTQSASGEVIDAYASVLKTMSDMFVHTKEHTH